MPRWLRSALTFLNEHHLAIGAFAALAGVLGLVGAAVWTFSQSTNVPKDPRTIARSAGRDTVVIEANDSSRVEVHTGDTYEVDPSVIDRLIEQAALRVRAELERDAAFSALATAGKAADSLRKQLSEALEALAAAALEPGATDTLENALAALQSGNTEVAERIFLVVERRASEGRKSLKEAAAAARHRGALAFLSDTGRALEAYRRAVEYDPKDPDGWNQLGQLHERTGDLPGAEHAYAQVGLLGEELGEKAWEAVALGNLGIIYQTRGDLEKAEENQLRALAIDEELGRKKGMAASLGNLGIIYQNRGDLERAKEYHLRALAIDEELGRKKGMAASLGNLGTIYQTRGDLEKGEEYHLRSLAIDEELGRKEGIAATLGNLGLLYKRRGELEKAEEYHLRSLEIFEELSLKLGIASQLGNLGLIYNRRGDLEKAEKYHLRSLAINEELGRREGMAKQLGNLGNIYHMRGDLEKARAHLERAKALFREVGAARELEQIKVRLMYLEAFGAD